MPRKNAAQQQPISDNTQSGANDILVCKAVDCGLPVVNDSKYCVTHHSENEALKVAQQVIKYDTDIFTMENDVLLTVTKRNSIGELLDIVVTGNYISFPLPSSSYFKSTVPMLDDVERTTLKEKTPYHLLQGKKGSNKLGLAIERIEQHRDHLVNAYLEVIQAVKYLEEGAPRTTNKVVAVNTKKDMLDKMPLPALIAWATSLGIPDDLDRDDMTKAMLAVI